MDGWMDGWPGPCRRPPRDLTVGARWISGEPIQMSAFPGSAVSPPFVYASSSQSVFIVPDTEAEARGEQRAPQVVAALSPKPSHHLVAVPAPASTGDRQLAVWIHQPPPGCGASALLAVVVEPASQLRWQTRMLPVGDEPKLLLAHPATQTLLLVTEGLSVMVDSSSSGGGKLHLPRAQALRIFDASSLDQIGSMALEAGSVVTALAPVPSDCHGMPSAASPMADFVMASTQRAPVSEYGVRDCHSFLSVLRIGGTFSARYVYLVQL